MASTASNDEKTANTAVKGEGDHDRVAMLSLKVDGTPDQHNPEIIGDKEFAKEAARRQFAEQAVSAADVAAREDAASADDVEAKPDPAVVEAEKITAAAEKAADKVVDSLHKG